MDIEPTFKGYLEDEKDALLIIQATMDGKLKHIPRRPYEIERSYLIASGNIFVFIEEVSGIKRWTDGITWSPSRIAGKFLIYKEIDKAIVYNKNKSKTLAKKHDHNHHKNRKNIIQSNENHNLNQDINNELNHKTRIKLPPLVHNNSNVTGDNNNNNMNNNNINPNDHDGERDGSGSSNNGGYNNENNRNILNPEFAKTSSSRSNNIMPYSGLIKKTISVNLKRNLLNHVETFHIVSYYTIDDVRENRLITPKDSLVFRNIKPSPELIIAMENTKLGNTKTSNKSNTASSSSGSTPRQLMDNISINSNTFQSMPLQQQQTPHLYGNNANIPDTVALGVSLQATSVKSSNSSGSGLNYRNPLKQDEYSISNPIASNNIIPPPMIGQVYHTNTGYTNSSNNSNSSSNSNNSNGNINANARIPPQSPIVQSSRFPIQPGSYVNGAPYQYPSNGSQVSGNPSNVANNNVNYARLPPGAIPPQSNQPAGYPYYYQDQSNGTAHTYSEGSAANNSVAVSGQVVPPINSTLYTSVENGNSVGNNTGYAVAFTNTAGNVIPPSQGTAVNGTYALYPSNNPVTVSNVIATNPATPANAGNSIGPSVNAQNTSYYNNSLAQPQVTTIQSYSVPPNGASSTKNLSGDIHNGGMVPTPVSLRNKNMTNRQGTPSYYGGYSGENATNYGAGYSTVATTSGQMGTQYPNQAMGVITSSNMKADGNYNPATQYASNVYTYPGTQQINESGTLPTTLPAGNGIPSQNVNQYAIGAAPYGYASPSVGYAINNDGMNPASVATVVSAANAGAATNASPTN